MKKAIKINNLVVLLLSMVIFTACVEDDDFSAPNLTVTEPTLDGPITDIDAVLGAYNQEGELITYDGENNLYMEGYVISSDEGGNWFKSLVLQDKPESPTAGIVIQLDVNPLFTRYEFGRKVYINLKGLSVAEDNGVIQIGRAAGNELERISEPMVNNVVLRSAEVATIVPKEVTIADFSDELESQFIRLTNMQFNRNDVLGEDPKTFASEDDDQFDGERNLESCVEGGSVILSTSTFSDFKSLLLPAGQGSIDAILTRDFFDDFYTIYLNSPEDINFDDGTRCDPDFFECDEASGGGAAFFSEDFEGFGTYTAEGWTNTNVSGTDTDWFISGFGGNNYSRISAFSSGNAEADVYLVTPAINMDGTTGEELFFDVQASFDNGTNLSVLVSTDFTGDPTTATWSILDASIPTGPGGTFGNFETVGPVNVSCLDGDVHFAFFYEGSDPGATTRYHVDNVEVTGN
ncbi:DUF5689 domain-containing protein [Lacinutrix salivirga]